MLEQFLWKWLYINLSIIGKMNNICIYAYQGSGSLLHNNMQDTGWNTGLDHGIMCIEYASSLLHCTSSFL